MVTVKFNDTQMRAMKRKLSRLSEFGLVNKKDLRRANRQIGKVYVKTARRNIQPMDREFTTIQGNRMNRNTLRRSMGVWRPKGGGNIMLAGPRASTLGRVAAYSNKDGFFAHFVEGGVARKTKYQGGNVGVFKRSMQSAQPQMAQIQLREYRSKFSKYVRKL